MSSYGPYPAVVTDWHDGDTCHVNLDLGFSMFVYAHDFDGKPVMSCRLFGVNAPELSTDAGKTALAFAQQTCPPGTRVTVVSHGWDKYGGRFDGSITLPDGRDMAVVMVESGNATPMTA